MTIQSGDGDVILDMRTKGIPGRIPSIGLDDIGAMNWNVLREDMSLPLAVMRESGIRHNSRWMKRFMEESGSQIAPHGKTSMSPMLFDLELEDGAWGITLATAHQVQVARSFGHKRIFLANQLVGKAAISFIMEELRTDPDFEFYCLADSLENVHDIARAARAAGLPKPVNMLVEIGIVGGRTGCRTIEDGLVVARAVAADTGTLVLAGVEGYEGLLRRRDGSESKALVDAFLDKLMDFAHRCDAEHLFGIERPILSAGGSQYYDLVVDSAADAGLRERFLVLVRSGCYLTQDSLVFKTAFDHLRERNPALAEMDGGLQTAIEVWAYVQSRPEPTSAILNFGKRDASHDHMPIALNWFRPGSDMNAPAEMDDGHVVTQLNDQHCFMTVPEETPLKVGDMVCFGISHPCLTFDKWRVVYVVNDDYDVVAAGSTYF
ncbi:amino acid deaminase [Aliihoeflea sp. PC F10.4]